MPSTCSNCGSSVSEFAHTCPKCGQPTSQSVYITSNTQSSYIVDQATAADNYQPPTGSPIDINGSVALNAQIPHPSNMQASQTYITSPNPNSNNNAKRIIAILLVFFAFFFGVIGGAVSQSPVVVLIAFALEIVAIVLSWMDKPQKRVFAIINTVLAIPAALFLLLLTAVLFTDGLPDSNEQPIEAVKVEETTSPTDEIVAAYKGCTTNNPEITATQNEDDTFNVSLSYNDPVRFTDVRVCGGDVRSVLKSVEYYHPEAYEVTNLLSETFNSTFATEVLVPSYSDDQPIVFTNLITGESGITVTPSDMEDGYAALRNASSNETSTSNATTSSQSNNNRDLFISDMKKYYGYDREEAAAAYDLLDILGCGGAKVLGNKMTSGTSLDAMQAIVDGHQINFTADNKVVFYVQITGWSTKDYGWFINWRGKLKYGEYDKKLAFDLYASDTGEGYIAYYDSATDSVIPWSEH